MSQCNYISTCVEPTSVSDGISCKFIKKTSTNLVLVKHNTMEVYSVKNPQKSTFITDDASLADRTLTLLKKYYTKEKITLIRAVRPYGSFRDNILLLTHSTDLVLLKYDRRVNDIVTVASAFVGTHMYPFSEVEHLCCVTFDHAYAALRLNSELIKVVRLEPTKGSRQLESKSFHIDDSIIINMGFIPDDNDRVILALLTERGQSRYIAVYELLFGSVQAIRIYGTVENGFDLATTQLLTFNNFDSGAVVLSSGLISYYHNLSVHTFMSPFLQSENIVSSCIINPYDETSIIIAIDSIGNLYQMTRVRDDDEAPFAVQVIGKMPLAQKLVHIADGLIFACSTIGNSYLLSVKENSDGNVECEFVDMHPGHGPITDMVKMKNDDNEDCGLLLCSGVGLEGTLQVLNNGFVITDTHLIDVAECIDMWVIRPKPQLGNSPTLAAATIYLIVMAFNMGTIVYNMCSHGGTCVNVPNEVANSLTLYASFICTERSSLASIDEPAVAASSPPSWIQVTPNHIAVVSCLDPYPIATTWKPRLNNDKILKSSEYYNSLLAVITNSGIYVLDVSPHKVISELNFIPVRSVQNVAISFSMGNPSKFIAYNSWGVNEINVVELNTTSPSIVARVMVSTRKFIISTCLLETTNPNVLLLFASLNNGVLTYCDVKLGTKSTQQPTTTTTHEMHTKISIPMSMNSQLSIIHVQQLQKLFVVNYGGNTVFLELNYSLLNNNNNNDNTTSLLNSDDVDCQNVPAKCYLRTPINYVNISDIRAVFLSPNDDNELIYLKSNAIFFGTFSYDSCHFVSKTMNLYETPLKICHQSETNAIALLISEPVDRNPTDNCVQSCYNRVLLTKGLIHPSELETPHPISLCSPAVQNIFDADDEDPDWQWIDIPNVYKVVFLNRDTLYPMFTQNFRRNEDVITIESLHLGQHNSFPYFVTTSNMTSNPQNTIYRGFVKLFQLKHNDLIMLDTVHIEGLVLSLVAFQRKLVVGVSGELHVYELNKNNKLLLLNKFPCGIIPAFFKVYNSELLVGDIMNNITIMEMVDSERGLLKVTLQSDMPGWATSAHILNNGMYMNSNIEKYIHIFTKERVCSKSTTINRFIEQIDQDDDVDIETDYVRDDNDPNMYRLIDDESRKKILDDNPKRYRVVAKHYTGEHITSICNAPYSALLHCSSSRSNNDHIASPSPPRGVSAASVAEISANTSDLHIVSPPWNDDVYSRILTYKPSYTTMVSSSAGGVKLFFELSSEQCSILFFVQRKIVRYHQYKRKASTSIDRNNDLIYTKNLKKSGGGFINGDIIRHVLRLPKHDALQLLSEIPICVVNPLTHEPIFPSGTTKLNYVADSVEEVNHLITKAIIINEPEPKVVVDCRTLNPEPPHQNGHAATLPAEQSSPGATAATVATATPRGYYPAEAVFQLLVDLNSLI